MVELCHRFFSSILVRFWSMGYKKRIALPILFILIVALSLVRLCLFADLSADFEFLEGQGSKSNASSRLWDKWAEENGYKAIGDIWDSCEPSEHRLMIGKIVLEFDKKTKLVMATAVANGTLRASCAAYMPSLLNLPDHSVLKGEVNIVAQYHGRTLYDHNENLCKVKAKSFSCPINKGQYLTVFESFPLPKYIPKGRYSAKARVINQDGLCVAIAESEIKI